MTVLVSYAGRPVATVGARRVYLLPEVERLPDGDPVLRFVSLMCAYALNVARDGDMTGYSDDDAAAFARSTLIDESTLRELTARSDAELATRFGVPVAEIVMRRAEIAD